MKSLFVCITILSAGLMAAEPPLVNMSDGYKIGVQNSILAKVNGTSISMMDVKKKMDLLFHQNYPNLVNSGQARYQFYEASWRHVFKEMVDNELILADAADKEIKLTDAEVREEMENRFGPNVISTLEQIGVSYDDAWKMVRNEMIVRRMTWWFIHSKAYAKVTPQDIRQAYRQHLAEHPPYTDWRYRMLTLRGEGLEAASIELHQKLLDFNQSPESIRELLDEFQASYPQVSIVLSNELYAKDDDLSEAHRSTLKDMSAGTYSNPVPQVTRDQKEVVRVFYLAAKTDHPAPTFEEISPILKNELLQKSAGEISYNYIDKLRKHYRFDADHLSETLPNDLHPFALQ